MSLSCQTLDSIKTFSNLVLCPLCGKFGDNVKYNSLMTCGHIFCDICIKNIILKSDNKCAKCYQLNIKYDIKEDKFMTQFTKLSIHLQSIVNNSQQIHNKHIQRSVSKQLLKKEPKTVQKDQKSLIIDSLKACVSGNKTKERKISGEFFIENINKKSDSRPLNKTKDQIMADLKLDYDPDLDVVPDSGGVEIPFTQNSIDINKDNQLMAKVTEIVTVLDSNSSDDPESVTNGESEQKLESNELKTNESKIPKKLNFEKKSKQKIFKSSSALKLNKFANKEKVGFKGKSSQVEKIEQKKFEEKEIQVCIERKVITKDEEIQVLLKEKSNDIKNETKEKGIQVLLKEKSNEMKVETNKSNSFTQTIAEQVVVRNQQMNDSSLRQIMTKFLELPQDLYPKLNTFLNSLVSIEKVDVNENEIKEIVENTVQEKVENTVQEKVENTVQEKVETKTESKQESIVSSEELMTDNKASKVLFKKQNSRSKVKPNQDPKDSTISVRPKRSTAGKRKKLYCSTSESEDNCESPKKMVNKSVAKRQSQTNSKNDTTVRKSNPRKQSKPKKIFLTEAQDSDEDKSVLDSKRSRSDSISKSNDEKFIKPVLRSPTLSNMSTTSSNESSRLRTSSTERKKEICVLSSGLDETQKRKLDNTVKELNGKLVNEWNDSVTHLVVGLVKDRPKKEMLCQRNIKYMKALLANKWIVSFDWIQDSLKSNRFIDESNYEIKGVKTAKQMNAPNKSRTNCIKLFEDRMVCFKGEFKLACDINDIKDLVTTGGGIVIDSENEFKLKAIKGITKMICVNDTIGLPNTQNNIRYMSINTFLDIISNFEDN